LRPEHVNRLQVRAEKNLASQASRAGEPIDIAVDVPICPW